MKARGGIRSSARLSGEATRNPGSGSNGGPGRPAEQAAAAAAAAQRRARAAERAREVEDSPRVLRDKCRRLARALRNAKHLVVYTGAGISTAADIPDYRGPHGVWTRLQRGETVGRVEVSLAQPTFTHMALTALWARGALKFVVSQNCDGLHLRAGLPRRALAELHGDMFCELCAACRRVILRAFDTTERTARHAHGTRRLCHACGAELRDSIVHFGERGRAAWPLNWAGALRHAARADVVLCLGSSLKVLRRYPRLWRMQAPPAARPALYIVNLQWTPKDAGAALKINARCDAVMRQLARRLRLRVPRYRAAADPLLAHAQPLLPAEAHTTSRPLLAPAPTHHAHEDFSSPSASDSDEELPLRRLAERLRVPPRPSPPPLARRVSPAERSCGMDEEVSSRNEKPFRAFSSIRSDESQQERYSLENKYVSPNERFFSSNKERSSNERPLSPNEFLVSLNNRNTTPNKRVSLLNDCPLSPKDNVSIYRNTSPNGRPLLVNMRSSSPHDISLMPNDRPLTPNDRPLAANDSPLAPNDRPLTLNDRTLTLNDRSFMPNDRTFTPNERPLTPNDRLMTPNDRLLTPSDRPLAPNDRPLTLNDRPLAPNVRLLTPCTTHYSPLTNSPNNRQFLANGKLPPPRGGRPPPDLLRAFQVKMHSGEATILLRAQHAPAPPPALTALRSFRMVRPRPGLTLNGEANDDEFTPIKKEITIKKEELIIKKEEFSMKTEKFDPRMEAGSEKDECAVDARLTKEEPCGGGGRALGSRLRRLLEGGAGADGAEEGAEALAAAYFARAVLVCRAQLYPGLHTILAPAPAAAAAECPWCLRRYQARRCLWYGPPRAPPAARRPQCACCGPNAPPHAKPEPQDGGGWYGKGYRKGRRKRR